jgi:D-alanyl-D-alanine carboxypeptidase
MAEPDSIDDFIQVMNRASDATRAAIAQQLKDAGFYKGKVTGKFDVKLYTALKGFGAELGLQRKFQQQFGQPTVSVIDYLQERAAEGTDDGSGDGAPRTTVTTYVTSASQTAKLLDTVAEDLLGRKLNKAEKAKYTRLVNDQQKKQPSVTTSGKGFSSTRGGVDEEQFVTEQIANTAEAKTNQASDAYTILMQELGGLR